MSLQWFQQLPFSTPSKPAGVRDQMPAPQLRHHLQHIGLDRRSKQLCVSVPGWRAAAEEQAHALLS